ncbi:MAG: substrate-binding domain-containing protein [Thermaerobacter sp.]|nr:substrate-binding domain-containing protein [Thermaerobacter sp.]
MKRTARITDVARYAGVSIATVSYVLTDSGRISPATRDRVMEAVEALGYHPSARARSLVLRRSRTVGLAEPQHTLRSDPWFSLFLAGVADVCRQRGYHVMLIAPLSGSGDEAGLAAVARSGLVDGVILMESADAPSTLEALESAEMPCVIYGRTDRGPWVDIDHEAGAALATRHLLDFGHQRIVHLALPADTAVGRLRRKGYEQALGHADMGLEPQVMVTDGSFAAGYHRTTELMAQPTRCTAVFAATDQLALGVIKRAGELGVEVPRQLSVVGFDDTPASRHAEPPLTSVAYDVETLGQAAADRLLDLIDRQAVAPLVVAPRLVARASAGPTGFVGTPATDPEEPVLKAGAAFAVWSHHGSFEPASGRQGVYLADTRLVSSYRLWIQGERVAPLTLTVGDESRTLDAVYVWQEPATTFRLERRVTLQEDGLVDEWHWARWGEARPITVRLQVSSDFADLFEVRGTPRQRHGQRRVTVRDGSQRIEYEGLDGLTRAVSIDVGPSAAEWRDDSCEWTLGVASAEAATAGAITVRVAWEQPGRCEVQGGTSSTRWPVIRTAHEATQRVLQRAERDLDLLAADFGAGSVPMAGLPWFGALFGRDALTVAWQTLEWTPELAVRVLSTLALYQGREHNPDTEEEPGRIVHEMRWGEMARHGEVPFGRYYGSVDATLLFVGLYGATWVRRGEGAWTETLRPAADAALAWLLAHVDADGLCRFQPQSARGLAIQSWKDSADSMVFANGEHGRPPFAVAEVQGYAYRALVLMSRFFADHREPDRASDLRARAETIRRAFHDRFWLPDRQYYALAVDGEGATVDGLSSDPGQCLWTGVVPSRASSWVVKRLTSPELWSGWGIRTLGTDEAAYDPYSYHRGSVWPHDTSLIAAGLRQSGFLEDAARVADALLEAATRMPHHRLPELFSGEPRTAGGPFPYPTACAPQAWASAAPFLLMTALSGFHVDTPRRVVHLAPLLTTLVPELVVEGVDIGGRAVDLVCTPSRVAVDGLPSGWRSVCRPAVAVDARTGAQSL